jgi:hypothetical protein
MKKLIFLFVFAFTFAHAQYVVEDNDITENSREMVNVKLPHLLVS